MRHSDLASDGQTLFANGHHHEQVFRFDLTNRECPKLAGTMERAGTLRYPHGAPRPQTGALSWDESFRSPDGALGLSFVRERSPHGTTGEAFGHAALFSR